MILSAFIKKRLYTILLPTVLSVFPLVIFGGCGGIGEMRSDLFVTAPVCVDNTNGNDANTGRGWDAAVKTITQAVSLVSGGGEIWVKKNYSNASTETISKSNISIYGGFGGAESRREERDVENGTLAGTINIAANTVNVVFDGFVFSGVGSAFSNVFYADTGTVVDLRNCTFQNNTVSSVVSSYTGSSLTISDCVFANNTGASGAALNTSGNATISSSVFSGNIATSNGGAIYVSSGTIKITDSTISNNSTTGAAASGGGLYVSSGTTIIKNSTFTSNVTTGNTADGGGLYTINGSLDVSDSLFESNSVFANGGGLCTYNTAVAVTGSTFQKNISTNNAGGGVFIEYTLTLRNVSISNSKFISNRAGSLAGGIFSTFANLFLSDSDVVNNISQETIGEGGGGIYLRTSPGVMTRCRIESNECNANTANKGGGGICLENGANSLTMNQCLLSSNKSNNGYGGGLNSRDNSPINIYNSLLYNNTALNYFELCNQASSAVLLSNCTLINSGLGVILYNPSSASNVITNSILYANGSLSINTPVVHSSFTNMTSGSAGFTILPSLSNEFAGFSSGNFRLANGSQLVDAGDNSYVYGVYDLDGSARVKGGTIDIGAYEKR